MIAEQVMHTHSEKVYYDNFVMVNLIANVCSVNRKIRLKYINVLFSLEKGENLKLVTAKNFDYLWRQGHKFHLNVRPILQTK